jgi:N-methylhydantoinase B
MNNPNPAKPRLHDPITTEVVKHELASITEATADTIMRTGRSHMIKLGDFAASLGDRHGRLLGIAETSPLQLSPLMDVLELLHENHGDLRPGDVYITNDPYLGMGHLPDVAVAVPAFVDDALVGYAISYSHHNDIGGHFPGGASSDSGDIYEEGLRIPLLRAYSGGVRDESLYALIRANVRSAEEWIGDLEAKVTGCRRGAEQLAEVVRKYGLAQVDETADYMLDLAEAGVRDALTRIPDGTYQHEQWFEDRSESVDTRLRINVQLHVTGDRMTVDFTGTSEQAARAVNLPYGATAGSVFGALKFLCDGEVVLNSGFTRRITIVAPEGTAVHPVLPGACGGRAPMMFAVYEAVLRALDVALPGRIGVPGEGGDMLQFNGVDDTGRVFMGNDVFFGGWGGRPVGQAVDGIAPLHFGALSANSIEVMERDIPIVFGRFELVQDSGGAGTSRGSLAVERSWEFRVPTDVMLRTCNLRPPPGLAGGLDGAVARTILRHDSDAQPLPLKTHLHLHLQAGDRLEHRIGGAGGFGPAFQRGPEAVLADVIDDKLSVAAARDLYGVVVDSTSHTVDAAATSELRGQSVATINDGS